MATCFMAGQSKSGLSNDDCFCPLSARVFDSFGQSNFGSRPDLIM